MEDYNATKLCKKINMALPITIKDLLYKQKIESNRNKIYE